MKARHIKLNQSRLNKIKVFSYVKNLPKKAKVLDLGVGTGVMFDRILELRPDIKCYGIDNTNRLTQKYIKYYRRNLDKPFKLNTRFDLIFSTHTFEHLYYPLICMKSIHKHLKPGGIFIVECPAWYTTLIPFGDNFYNNPTHVRPFTRRTIELLFNFAHYGIVNYKFKVLEIKYIASYWSYLNEQNIIRRILLRMGLLRSAVCGIGKKI